MLLFYVLFLCCVLLSIMPVSVPQSCQGFMEIYSEKSWHLYDQPFMLQVLFNDTIFHNIHYGRLAATEEEVVGWTSAFPLFIYLFF